MKFCLHVIRWLDNQRCLILRMANSETESGSLFLGDIDSFGTVCTRSRLDGAISWHDVPRGHGELGRGSLVDVGLWSLVGSWTWGPGQIFIKTSLLATAHKRIVRS